MNKKHMKLATILLFAAILTSACGANNNTGATGGNTSSTPTPPIESSQPENSSGDVTEGNEALDPSDEAADGNGTEADQGNQAGEETGQAAEDELLIIIDQSEKPSDANSFDFSVVQYPEGYSLAEMQWVSQQTTVTNTTQEAIEHGGNGEDGFYISGNGQFSGFFYPDSMIGETGKVIIIFRNEAGDEVKWEKEITLL